MFSGKLGRRTLTSWIAGAMLALAVPALAQTGRVQGKVVDEKDVPVADAQILVTAIPDQGGQKWQAKTDKNGNYIIGTLPKWNAVCRGFMKKHSPPVTLRICGIGHPAIFTVCFRVHIFRPEIIRNF